MTFFPGARWFLPPCFFNFDSVKEETDEIQSCLKREVSQLSRNRIFQRISTSVNVTDLTIRTFS